MKHILVVDDILENRKIIASMLKQTTRLKNSTLPKQTIRWNIMTAGRGKAVLRLFEGGFPHLPDLILLDIMLPDLNGIRVYQALKEIPQAADIPVIFITSHSMLENKKKTLAKFNAEYLTKPVTRENLLKKIGKFLKVD